jgi:long-chain acyl-CoA synthetase
MGVRKEMKRARRSMGGQAVTVETVRDEHGVVREARTPALAAPPERGSIADLPFTNAAGAPDAVVLRRRGDDGTWSSPAR